MEDYVAEGERPLQRCLEHVTNCDAYVGIFAWRYGSIPKDAGPPPHPPNTQPGKTSITEFEFRCAAQLNTKPMLLFLLDPEADWPASQIDAVTGEGEKGKRIARLRKEIGQNYLVGHFRTPEELASLVSAAVYRQEMSRQVSVETLTHAEVDQHFARDTMVSQSSLMEITSKIQQPGGIQELRIDLGDGNQWWMTRLYLLASLASDLTSVEIIVFLENGSFVAMAHPELVKERLYAMNPSFELYEKALAALEPQPDFQAEVNQGIATWNNQVKNEGVNPVFVTRANLERWFRHSLIEDSIDRAPNEDDALQMQRIMDWPTRFVPLSENGAFQRVIDKQALAEKIARIFVREQVARSLSMTRR